MTLPPEFNGRIADRPMRVAIVSYAFKPSVGGIEAVSYSLATEFRRLGHMVSVITHTLDATSQGIAEDPEVLRRPDTRSLIRALRSADAVVVANITLKYSWPLFFGLVRRPWIIVNHTPISRPNGELALVDRFKRLLLRVASHYSVSRYLANAIGIGSQILPNPYDDEVFVRRTSTIDKRPKDLLFVGRLVRAKGPDVLLNALSLLAKSGSFQPSVTIVGDGPLRAELEELTDSLGLGNSVSFLGALPSLEVANVMREHKVLVVPSRCEPPEAFGLVVIEGLACGCHIVAADQGGLPEAVGGFGQLVPPEDEIRLGSAIRVVLERAELKPDADYLDRVERHLENFRSKTVALKYLSVLQEKALGKLS